MKQYLFETGSDFLLINADTTDEARDLFLEKYGSTEFVTITVLSDEHGLVLYGSTNDYGLYIDKVIKSQEEN